MQRIPEPELMDDPAQARAYAEADFEAPHAQIVAHLVRAFADAPVEGPILDLGCGPADITVRLAGCYPGCRIDGVDGAEAMLALGRARIRRAGLAGRVRLIHARLPGPSLAQAAYPTLVSNSLLHHLHAPAGLWETIKVAAAPAARVFVADLRRPDNAETARRLVATYAAGEPDVLRRDFYNSLCAAFTPEEIGVQLDEAGLGALRVEAVDDRHVVVYGRLA